MKRMLHRVNIIWNQEKSYDQNEILDRILSQAAIQHKIYYPQGEHSLWEKTVERKAEAVNTLWITDERELAIQLQEAGKAVLLYCANCENAWGVKYCIEGFEETDAAFFDQIYCRCMQLPWSVMETDRILIREITVEDVEELYRIYEKPSITKYMENLYPTREQEREYTEAYIQNIYGFYGFGMWILEDRLTGKVIGRAGIESKEGWEGLEIGFMVAEEYQHQGYAFEACSAIIQYAREELGEHSFYAQVMKGNEASKGLLVKLGFFDAEEVNVNGVRYHIFKLL